MFSHLGLLRVRGGLGSWSVLGQTRNLTDIFKLILSDRCVSPSALCGCHCQCLSSVLTPLLSEFGLGSAWSWTGATSAVALCYQVAPSPRVCVYCLLLPARRISSRTFLLQSQKNKEYLTQKISTIRMMYEKVAEDYEVVITAGAIRCLQLALAAAVMAVATISCCAEAPDSSLLWMVSCFSVWLHFTEERHAV